MIDIKDPCDHGHPKGVCSFCVTAEEASSFNSDLLCFDDAISIAKGSLDYMGGYRNENELAIYYHGIQTVINVLEAAKKKESEARTSP